MRNPIALMLLIVVFSACGGDDPAERALELIDRDIQARCRCVIGPMFLTPEECIEARNAEYPVTRRDCIRASIDGASTEARNAVQCGSDAYEEYLDCLDASECDDGHPYDTESCGIVYEASLGSCPPRDAELDAALETCE